MRPEKQMMQASKGRHSRQSDGFESMGGTKVLVELLGRDNQ
jgi:hypothetical protein